MSDALTDGQTDRRTDRFTAAHTALYSVAVTRNLVWLKRVESLDFKSAAWIVASQAARLEDGLLRVVAAVGELGAREGVEAARALEVVDRAPDVPVDVAPRRQLVPGLQQPLAHVPRRVRLVRVREPAVAVDGHSAMHTIARQQPVWAVVV